MTLYNFRYQPLLSGFLMLPAAWLALGCAQADLSNVICIVLQQGKHYDPGNLILRWGDTITLVNGDEKALHHAFIEADRFAFDAGDQEPGKQTTLILREAGDFVIQCGTHPTMKLTLHVQ